MGAKEEDLKCDPKACLFSRGVGNFELIFLSHFLTKMRSFCAHQKGNFLNFAKLTLLLSLVHSWCPLWPVKRKRAFFLGHPVVIIYLSISVKTKCGCFWTNKDFVEGKNNKKEQFEQETTQKRC